MSEGTTVSWWQCEQGEPYEAFYVRCAREQGRLMGLDETSASPFPAWKHRLTRKQKRQLKDTTEEL